MDSTRLQLQRTMSLTDINTSSAIRDEIERDLTVPADRSKHRFFLLLPRHDFILPSLTRFDQDFRKFLLSALVDFPLKQELEDRRYLNWCSVLPNFLPLQTLGDGNCLMHAVSLCMWAVQDRRLTLRKSVYQVLIEDQTGMLRKRWQLEQEQRLEEQHGSSVACSNEQWDEDWKKIVDLASMTKFSETHSLNALEEIHIFTLANILRRPIFVLCDDVHRGNYDESLADVNLGGIFLPLLCDSVDCIKSPLVIGYHQGHFMALVTTEDGSTTGEDMMGQRRNKIAIPLMKYDNSTMKLHFLLPEEQQCSDRLLREYLNCAKVEYTNNEVTRTILVAKMQQSQEPEAHLNQMCKTYFKALQEVYLEKLRERQLSMYGEQPHSSVMQTGNQHYGMKYHAPETAISPAVKTSSRCCSAHKKCKNVVCENYTTQDYCHQCRQSKPQLCTSPGCTYAANPNSEGLCSACFARFRAILEQDVPRMVAPSAPPSNMCSTQDCQKQACPQFHGKCHDCFLKYIHDPNFGNNTFASSEPTDEPHKSREKHEPHLALSRQNSRLFCFSQRCKNLLQNSEQIYCEHCLACLPPELKTHLQTLVSRNIDICCVFGCDLPAVTYHGQLCYQHYEESLGRHQNDDHVAAPQMTKSQQATRCITIGCKFFGIPDHNYLCSRCHAKALQEQYDVEKIKAEQERAQAEWIAKLARRRAEQCQFDFYGCNASPKPFYHEVISTPTTSSSAPPSPNQRKTATDTVPCATKGCPHLGFKQTEGLCEVCYKKEEMLLYQGISRRDRFSSLP